MERLKHLEGSINIEIQINDIYDWINNEVNKIFCETGSDKDIIISIPEHIYSLMKSYLEMKGFPVKYDDDISNDRLYGCPVQYAYENKITVFHKRGHLTKMPYAQLELN